MKHEREEREAHQEKVHADLQVIHRALHAFLTQLLWNGSEWFRPATRALIRVKRSGWCGRCLNDD